MERQAELLDKITKRKKALENYEKKKRKDAEKTAENNYQKLEMTRQCEEKLQRDRVAL